MIDRRLDLVSQVADPARAVDRDAIIALLDRIAAAVEAPAVGAGTYLRVAEAAALLRLSEKRVRNLMADGILRKGEHWFSPAGISPRFKRVALIAWLEGATTSARLAPEGRAFVGLAAQARRA